MRAVSPFASHREEKREEGASVAERDRSRERRSEREREGAGLLKWLFFNERRERWPLPATRVVLTMVLK